MIQVSDVTIMTDNRELGLFLASTMTRELGLGGGGAGEIAQLRCHPWHHLQRNSAQRAGLPNQMEEQTRTPTEEEMRKMLGIMVDFSINMCIEHHFYIDK